MAVLHEIYAPQGFSVLAFPITDFHQEFSKDEEIYNFLHQEFPEISFPVFGVSSLKENVVFQQLKKQIKEEPQHNFFKYLVDRKGMAVKLFTKKEDPMSFESEIKALLSRDAAQQQ